MTRERIRETLAKKTVGIIGAGGLGSNCAAALARAGIGTLVVSDFDVVCESNLDRQFFFRKQVGMRKIDALRDNLEAIDGAVAIETYPARVDPSSFAGLFSGCDAIVEAVDLAETKAMLAECACTLLPSVPYITASGIAGYGSARPLRTVRSGSMTLVGDFCTEVDDETPPLAPRVFAAAGLQADAVLEALLGPQDQKGNA